MAKLELVAPKLPASCAISVGGREFRVPVASTGLQQQAGLRDRFGFSGMIFDPAPDALTMDGVKLPLQAILARPDPRGYVVVRSIKMMPGVATYPVIGNVTGAILVELFPSVPVAAGDALSIFSCEHGL